MTDWMKAPPEVITIANSIIEQYHPTLVRARIGFLMRDFAPVSKGRRTMGKAAKVNSQWLPLLQDKLDLVIWLAMDAWAELTPSQRRALVDHELCHCKMTEEDEAVIMPHDLEEFRCIVDRHGLWSDDLQLFAAATSHYQPTLFSRPERNGFVTALEPTMQLEMAE